MPGLFTGFLKGFNDATTAARTEASRQQDLQMERDQNILLTLAQHSEDKGVQANAIHGLVSMTRGDYQPKSGFAKFFGKPGAESPQILSLIDALKGSGGPGVGGGGSQPGAAPAGATATQPTTTLGESPVGAGAVESGAAGGASPPPAPSAGGAPEDEPLPTMGLAALPGGSTSALTGTQPGNRSSVAPVAGGGTAPIKPVQGATTPLSAPPIAPSPGGAGPSAGVTPPPAPRTLGMPSLTRPTLAPGQQFYTPSEQADLNTWRQAQLPAAEQEARYQLGYQDAIASGMSPQAAHAEALRRAGVQPILAQARPDQVTIGADGLLHHLNVTFRPDLGQYENSEGPLYMGTQGGNPNELEATAQSMGLIPAGTPAGMGWTMLAPDKKLAAQNELYRRQVMQAGNKTAATQAEQITPLTTETGSQVLVKKGTALAGGGGPPAATRIPPPPPLTPPPAPKGAATVSAPPPVGTQVGSNPGHPEAPVTVGPQQETPQGVPATTPSTPAPKGPMEVKPSPALPLEQVTDHSALGQPYIDANKIGTGDQAKFTRTAAAKSGLPVIDHDDAAVLRSLQAARANIRDFAAQILPYLATSAASRPATAFGNWLSELTQSNPELAGLIGRWGTAVANVKSTGVSRTNNAEIAKGLEGLPEPSDTIDTAYSKIRGMTDQFNNMEHSILPLPPELTRKAPSALTQHPEGAKIKLTEAPYAGQVWAIPPDGSTGYIRIK